MHHHRDDHDQFERIREMAEMKMTMIAEQIRKLGELRDEGLLTEEEFSAAKSQLLSHL